MFRLKCQYDLDENRKVKTVNCEFKNKKSKM